MFPVGPFGYETLHGSRDAAVELKGIVHRRELP